MLNPSNGWLWRKGCNWLSHHLISLDIPMLNNKLSMVILNDITTIRTVRIWRLHMLLLVPLSWRCHLIPVWKLNELIKHHIFSLFLIYTHLFTILRQNQPWNLRLAKVLFAVWALLNKNSSRIAELVFSLWNLYSPAILLGTLSCSLACTRSIVMIETKVLSSIYKIDWVLFLNQLILHGWFLFFVILVVYLRYLFFKWIENLILSWTWNLWFRWDEAWLNEIVLNFIVPRHWC